MIWLCDDGGGTMEVEADSAREAAEECVDLGDWGSDGGPVTVYVHRADPAEEGAICCYQGCDEPAQYLDDEDDPVCRRHVLHRTLVVVVEPEEPDCVEADHEWCSPYRLLGGCRENPGVWGHGGGVIIREVCRYCGVYRETDTWATDPDTGAQGLRVTRYKPADERSERWVAEEAEA